MESFPGHHCTEYHAEQWSSALIVVIIIHTTGDATIH